MSLAAKLPWTHRYARGFPGIIGSQTLPTDADAIDYLTRMAAADGAGVEVSVAVAVDEFFADAKELGVFSAIRASCLLAGARTLAGALVPLRDYGPELWTGTLSILSGATGSWSAATKTATHSGYAEYSSYPRFSFAVGIQSGKQYKITGRLSGDLDGIFSLSLSGAAVLFDVSTGEFSATVTADASTYFSMFFRGQNYSDISVTIESLSIREVIASPTNVANGFVSGDYTRGGATPGLKGDGTSYLDSGRATTADPDSDHHMEAYITAGSVPPAKYVAGGRSASPDVWTSIGGILYSRTNTNSDISTATAGLCGVSRSASDRFYGKKSGTAVQEYEVAATPSTVDSSNIFVFAYNSSSTVASPNGFTDATVAFYSIGTSLSLADLDTAVTNLITRLKFAFLTGENPAPYDIDTVTYVVRGYENGGTLE